MMLQQYLPLAVLKLSPWRILYSTRLLQVATVLTACGIETFFTKTYRECVRCCNSTYRLRYWNPMIICAAGATSDSLQQYLPLAVLKLNSFWHVRSVCLNKLQQYLPLAVLKQPWAPPSIFLDSASCNSTYRLRYWNAHTINIMNITITLLQQYLPLAVLKLIVPYKPCRLLWVATVLTACGIET